MPATSRWFLRLGFEVWHVPGISRAWRYDFADGSFVLVTDLGGYDLPEPGGPYSAMSLSAANELVDYQEWLRDTKDLFRWFSRMSRLCARRAQ